MLHVADEDELLGYADILSGWTARPCRKPFALFHEPDLGAGEHTALASVSDGREFSRLPLAGAAYVTT